MLRKCAVLLLAVVLMSFSAFAEEAEMYFRRDGYNLKSYPAAPRLAQRAGVSPAVTLRAATEVIPEEVDALRTWNANGGRPMRNGFFRSLGETINITVGAQAAKSGSASRGVLAASDRGIVWSSSFHVAGAHRLRARLDEVKLPAGTTLWVYGSNQEPIGFDASLVHEGTLWTPSVKGDTLWLEVEIPNDGVASFKVRQLLELVQVDAKAGLKPGTEDAPTCLVKANCRNSSNFPAIDAASKAVAQLEIVTAQGGGLCSGGLITDQQQSGTPYFLTANHCLSQQSEAATLEAYFDYRWASCDSTQASTLQPVIGSTLLATAESSDFTLLRLSSLPAGRVLMGWTTTKPGVGTALHRLSHPAPDQIGFELPQMYSRTIVVGNGASQCQSWLSNQNFISSNESNGGEGGVYGGSSGSLVMLADGKIVGQLLGSCGPDPQAGCDRRDNTLDGAFSASFPAMRQFLAGGNPAQPTPCTPSANTICLVDNRFGVRVTYNDGSGARNATAIKYTPESGLFWFSDAGNIEVLLKMVDACGFNQRFWVYAGGTTDLEIGITVTDSRTGTVKTYTSPRGSAFRTITDSNAFATCQ